MIVECALEQCLLAVRPRTTDWFELFSGANRVIWFEILDQKQAQRLNGVRREFKRSCAIEFAPVQRLHGATSESLPDSCRFHRHSAKCQGAKRNLLQLKGRLYLSVLSRSTLLFGHVLPRSPFGHFSLILIADADLSVVFEMKTATNSWRMKHHLVANVGVGL